MEIMSEQQSENYGVFAAPIEQGPMKSVNPEFAAAVRARHRKEVDALEVGEHLDLSLPDDLDFTGEGADDEETELRFTEDGILIEPFNMRAEQFAGYFDDEENYVARVNKDDTDAWMQTIEDGEGVVRGDRLAGPSKVKHGSHRLNDQPEMGSGDRADYKQRIVQKLRTGENVLDALRRLGVQNGTPESGSPRSKAEKLAQLRSKIAGTVPSENRAAFDSLTEAAGQLLVTGDANVYTKSREALLADIKKDLKETLGHTQHRQLPPSTRAVPQSSHAQPSQSQQTMGNRDVDLGRDQQDDSARLEGPTGAQAIPVPGPMDTGMSPEDSAEGSTPAKRRKRDADLQGEADNPMDPEKGMNGFQFNEAEGTYYNHDIGCIYDPKQQRYRDANSGRWFKYVDGGYREVSP